MTVGLGCTVTMMRKETITETVTGDARGKDARRRSQETLNLGVHTRAGLLLIESQHNPYHFIFEHLVFASSDYTMKSSRCQLVTNIL